MTQIITDQLKKYPQKELTKQLIGLAFQTYNELGYGYREKIYQQAYSYKLQEVKIRYKREQYSLVKVADKPVGRYYVDFIVEDKVVIEFKIANEFFDSHIQQILSYLKACGLQIGLLFLIRKDGIKIKRLIN